MSIATHGMRWRRRRRAMSEMTETSETSETEGETPAPEAPDAGPDGEAAVGAETEVGDGAESGVRRGRLEREGEVAADFLETLLDIADLDGDIDIDIDGDRASVSILDSDEGRVPRRLVGQDAKVLEALQELTRLAVQSATGERSRLMLDIAGHRADRRAALVKVAQEAIEKARTSGDEVALEPMSAFERKVIHDEVLAAGLTSESDGVEPRRHVVVIPS
jgi:spoIIIJ-associated protein